MSLLVVDASATVAWCFADEETPQSEALLERFRSSDQAVVPAHWPTEVMNALVMGVRRQRLTFDQVLEFVEALAALPILIAAPNPMADWTSLLTLAIQTQLTIYDAAYLQLAIQHNVPLATLDKDLRVAAQNVGIGLINLA